MYKVIVLIISLTLLSLFPLKSENNLIFKKIDNKLGLSQNGVMAVFQDKDGCMWFGTHYGLNRYDGFQVKSFYRGNTEHDLCGNDIQTIFQDSIGNIWIATIDGVAVYNPISNTFFNLKKFSGKSSIFNHTILSMKYIDHHILISSKEGLWKINAGTKLFTDEIAKQICNDISQYKIKPIEHLHSIKVHFKDQNDNYWITANNQIVSSKIIGNKLIVIDKVKIDNSSDIELTVLYQDVYKNIWVGTTNQGLYKLKEVKGDYIPVKVHANGHQSFSVITDILQDKALNLWISTRSDGVMMVSKNDLWGDNIVAQKITTPSLTSKKIKSIFISRDHSIWLGSLGNGVFYSNSGGLNFKNYQLSDHLNNPAVNYTRAISKDSYQRLWFGTLFEGLYIYDPKQSSVSKTLLSRQSVFSLVAISANCYMAGCTDGIYLINYNQQNFNVQKINPKIDIKGPVFSIAFQSNKFWIGTGSGFASFTLTANNKIDQLQYYNSKLLVNTNSQNTIRKVKYDAANRCIWIGSETSGLIRASLDNELNIKDFTSINQRFKIESNNNYISDIYVDPNHTCWASSRGGLMQIQLSTSGKIEKLSIYTTKDGLPSNLIQSILNDKNGDLWLGTIRGLVRFKFKTHHIINYDINDGIQDYEFSEHSSFADADGTMYFGGINGVTAFVPNKMRYDNYVEPVVLSDILLNNESSKYLFYNTNNDKATLDYNQNSLKFNFISCNYINPFKCKYAYMLEGFDKDWIYTTAENRTAEYSNLPSGEYVFKVKSTNEDGIWSSKIATVKFEIEPSFWLSFPGFLFYITAITLLIYAVSTITKKRLKKKHDELLEKQYHEQIEKNNQSKLQFFINISHEIRTPLTLIVCSVEKLISELRLTKEQQKETATIENNINRMLHLTNELLGISKIETGNYHLSVIKANIVQFTNNIVFAFEPLAEKQNIQLTFESELPEIELYFDTNILEKSVSNLISNAIKYNREGGSIQVKIETTTDKKHIEISVSDTGIGIEDAQLAKIFDRFYQLEGKNESYENGFGIGLHFTKNLIDLHKGTISVESEIHKGSKFKISLSLDDYHYSSHEKADKMINNQENENKFEDYKYLDFKDLHRDTAELEESSQVHTYTLLYVDDNIELLENISNYLSEKYNVLTAINGKEGFEKACQHQPDVIISDIVMPEMDGFELCTRIKADINTSHIPIILLTARGDSDSHYKGIESGADYFIPKPFNIKLLVLTIKNLIESREKLRKLFQSKQEIIPTEITTNSRDKQFMEKLLNYVEEHIGEDNLNIEFIADNFAMSRSTFFRKIKAITGTTGKEFIDSVRLKRAARLLIETDLNISEIAYEIGHSNPQYFSKWFKAHYKVSPTEYIQQHKL